MRGLIRSFVEEGRTVFLSSHLLDEVEKTTDEVAIVDQGRIVMQRPVAQIASGGDTALLVEVDDAAAVRRVLGTVPDVRSITDDGAALRVTSATASTPQPSTGS